MRCGNLVKFALVGWLSASLVLAPIVRADDDPDPIAKGIGVASGVFTKSDAARFGLFLYLLIEHGAKLFSRQDVQIARKLTKHLKIWGNRQADAKILDEATAHLDKEKPAMALQLVDSYFAYLKAKARLDKVIRHIPKPPSEDELSKALAHSDVPKAARASWRNSYQQIKRALSTAYPGLPIEEAMRADWFKTSDITYLREWTTLNRNFPDVYTKSPDWPSDYEHAVASTSLAARLFKHKLKAVEDALDVPAVMTGPIVADIEPVEGQPGLFSKAAHKFPYDQLPERITLMCQGAMESLAGERLGIKDANSLSGKLYTHYVLVRPVTNRIMGGIVVAGLVGTGARLIRQNGLGVFNFLGRHSEITRKQETSNVAQKNFDSSFVGQMGLNQSELQPFTNLVAKELQAHHRFIMDMVDHYQSEHTSANLDPKLKEGLLAANKKSESDLDQDIVMKIPSGFSNASGTVLAKWKDVSFDHFKKFLMQLHDDPHNDALKTVQAKSNVREFLTMFYRQLLRQTFLEMDVSMHADEDLPYTENISKLLAADTLAKMDKLEIAYPSNLSPHPSVVDFTLPMGAESSPADTANGNSSVAGIIDHLVGKTSAVAPATSLLVPKKADASR